MDIDQYYKPLMEDLRQGKRVFFKAPKPVMKEISEYFAETVQNANKVEMRKVLCLVDHCQLPQTFFTDIICQALEKEDDPELIVFLLSSSTTHIIRRIKEGEIRAPESYLQSLQKLLTHSNPEVVEWNLRIIEQMPKLPNALKLIVLKNKPSVLKILDKHQKASRQIITMLEKRWHHVRK